MSPTTQQQSQYVNTLAEKQKKRPVPKPRTSMERWPTSQAPLLNRAELAGSREEGTKSRDLNKFKFCYQIILNMSTVI